MSGVNSFVVVLLSGGEDFVEGGFRVGVDCSNGVCGCCCLCECWVEGAHSVLVPFGEGVSVYIHYYTLSDVDKSMPIFLYTTPTSQVAWNQTSNKGEHMSLINPDDIFDNLDEWTDDERVIEKLKSMKTSEIEEYFEDFLDTEEISNLCYDAYNNGILAMERELT